MKKVIRFLNTYVQYFFPGLERQELFGLGLAARQLMFDAILSFD
jgi:hypothetical protein